MVSHPTAMVIAVAIVAGAARGLFTLLAATAVSDRWGTRRFGTLNGILAAPMTAAMAISPWIGTLLAERLGSYSAMFTVLAVIIAVAAGISLGRHTPCGRSQRGAVGPPAGHVVCHVPLTHTTTDWLHQGVLISDATDVIRLLADPLRAQIVQILADGPACTCHLVADTDAKQPNISGHLRLLREAGIVATEPHGRFTYYRLIPEALRAAAAELSALADRADATAASRREC